MEASEIADLLPYLTQAERTELDTLLTNIPTPLWAPLPGPQTLAYNAQADVTGYGGAAGGGKGLALDTLLPTPQGFTTMGDVRVGDVVFDDRGQPCTVTAVSALSHRPCFLLEFDDSTQVVADDVHRWRTFDAKELAQLTRRDPEWQAARRAKRPSRAKDTTSPARLAALAKLNQPGRGQLPAPAGEIRDTAEIHATLRTPKGRANHAIDLAGALALPDAALPIPPYTLGAWLGDGASRNGQLTGEDSAIWERIERDGFTVVHYNWNDQAHNILGLKVKLRDLGVLQNKHIPTMYLRASRTQRLALLQGLMDTDGHAALDGGSEFDGVNETLVRGVFDLVRSLGIKATLQKGVAKLDGRVISDKWRVKFTTSLPVFGMPRKLERLPAATRRTQRMRYLVACTPVASVATKCIAVDSPNRMYLATAAMLPTHNTDLACGLALTAHLKVGMFRQIGTELSGIIDRLRELVPDITFDRFGTARFKTPEGITRQIELGSFPDIGDEEKYRGKPHDLLVYDEATAMREHAFRFTMGWLRTTVPGQRCRALLTFNPPTNAEGRWVIRYFAPWLDKKHPNPAAPGELRYFATVNGEDMEVPDQRPFVLSDQHERVYAFDASAYKPTDIITPMSRTFIPSRVSDNPHLMGTAYIKTLQALEEPLRSQMLNGDFNAGIQDDAWQLIPTAWVELAQSRWKPLDPKPPMDSIGVDVARGGKDNTVVACRHGMWFDRLNVYPGKDTATGAKTAALCLRHKRDAAPIHIDIIGVGSSPYDVLMDLGQHTLGINVGERPRSVSLSGVPFANYRTELWWRMREALNPEANNGIALPPDPQLLADLTAPRYCLQSNAYKVESREDIVKRIGRSPDWASALMLALIDTPKADTVRRMLRSGSHSPFMGIQDQNPSTYDPLAHI